MRRRKVEPIGAPYQCKGRIKPTRKGKAFCYRLRRMQDSIITPVYVVELNSTRNGKTIGYLAKQSRFTPDPKKAERFSEYKENAEAAFNNLLWDASGGSLFRWNREARKTLKKIEKAAE